MSNIDRCPKCGYRLREVTRSELKDLAYASRCRVVMSRPHRLVTGYWWCMGCLNGGAFYDLASAVRTKTGQPADAPAARTARSGRRPRRR